MSIMKMVTLCIISTGIHSYTLNVNRICESGNLIIFNTTPWDGHNMFKLLSCKSENVAAKNIGLFSYYKVHMCCKGSS